MLKPEKAKKYDIFINTIDGIKDEYKNVSISIDEIFVTVMLADGRHIAYPIKNISRVNFKLSQFTK